MQNPETENIEQDTSEESPKIEIRESETQKLDRSEVEKTPIETLSEAVETKVQNDHRKKLIGLGFVTAGLFLLLG